MGHSGLKPPILDFGNFCAEVPESLHIGLYLRISLVSAFGRAITKPLQPVTFDVRGFRRPA